MSVFQRLLNQDYAIHRKVRASDGQGGWSEAWTELATVRGRLRPVSAEERTIADEVEAEVTHVLYTLASEDIARGDIVAGAGRTVRVLAVREPSQAGHHLQIDCRELQQEEVAEWGS